MSSVAIRSLPRTPELFREVLDADALGHRDGAGDGQRLRGNLGSTETRWRSKALHRAFFGLRVLLAATAAWRPPRTLRTRRFARRRHQTAGAPPGPGRWPKPGRAPTRALAEARTRARGSACRRAAGGVHGTACAGDPGAPPGASTRAGTLLAGAPPGRDGRWDGRAGCLPGPAAPCGATGAGAGQARARRGIDRPRAGLRHDDAARRRCGRSDLQVHQRQAAAAAGCSSRSGRSAAAGGVRAGGFAAGGRRRLRRNRIAR